MSEELEATRCPICHIRLGHDVHCPDYPYATKAEKWQVRSAGGAATDASADDLTPYAGLPADEVMRRVEGST